MVDGTQLKNFRMKHIAVNTRLLLKDRLEGISRFAYEVLKRMVEQHPNIQFSFFFDRAYDQQFIFGENVNAYVIPPQARHPVLWYLWFHVMSKRKLNQLKPDIYFSPEFYHTNHPDIPQIPVFHDIAYEHYPEDIAKWASKYCRYYSPIYAKQAAHILTVSEYSKQDISTHYHLDSEKISVVYNGASTHFRPLLLEEKKQVWAKYTEGHEYFYFVGTLQPRKNIVKLLSAFDRFRSSTHAPVKLLIVGRKGWQYFDALQTYHRMRFKDEVHFTGFVSDQELVRITAAAIGLCYVPYLEGFGIPILEALQCDTPVICSHVSSMPEVAGEAALLVDPNSEEEIANAMQDLYQNESLRATLILKGREQRRHFSWDKTYKKVWEVIERFL